MTDLPALLATLKQAGVEFIVVGGVAATVHGSARLTLDLDVVYRRTPENRRRVFEAFQSLSPYPRGAPPGLPFQWDERSIAQGLNFTLTTGLGAVDLLGEITGGGDYDALLPHTVEMEPFGVKCRCLTLSKLIEVKAAAGRPKDFEILAELETIKEERGDSDECPPKASVKPRSSLG
jgi:hypothetical protein